MQITVSYDYKLYTPPGFVRDNQTLCALYGNHPEELCEGNFDIIAEVIDEKGRHFLLANFLNNFDDDVQVLIPRKARHNAIISLLREHGLEIASRSHRVKEKLVSFIDAYPITRRIRIISQRWYEGVYYTRVGAANRAALVEEQAESGFGEDLFDEAALSDSFTDRTIHCGTLANWQSTVGAACVGNRLLVFSVSSALSAPILEPLGAESMGFMLYADTTTGKTVTASAACSVAGTPPSSCDATPAGVETLAHENSDTFLLMDELGGRDKPVDFAQNIYKLGNGIGRSRYLKKTVKWRLVWMIIGEEPMSKFLADKGKELTGGQRVRLIEIFAKVNDNYGSFDTIHNEKGSAEFAKKLEVACKQNQGVVAEAFLARVCADLPSAVKRLNEIRDQFKATEIEKLNLTRAPRELIRALDHFAVVAASGEIASEFKVTGWPEGEAIRAVATTFEAWYAREHQTLAPETHRQTIQQDVRAAVQWIAANRDRLEKIEKKSYTDYLIPVIEFRDGACAGMNHELIAKQLKNTGNLIHNKNRLTLRKRGVSDPDDRFYVYCVRIKSEDIESSGDSEDKRDGWWRGGGNTIN